MFGGLNVRLALSEGGTARLSGQKSTGHMYETRTAFARPGKCLVRRIVDKTTMQFAKGNEPTRRFIPKREPHACKTLTE